MTETKKSKTSGDVSAADLSMWNLVSPAHSPTRALEHAELIEKLIAATKVKVSSAPRTATEMSGVGIGYPSMPTYRENPWSMLEKDRALTTDWMEKGKPSWYDDAQPSTSVLKKKEKELAAKVERLLEENRLLRVDNATLEKQNAALEEALLVIGQHTMEKTNE